MPFFVQGVKNWNRLPLSVASVIEQRKFKQHLHSYVYALFFLLFVFTSLCGLIWSLCPFPISKYIRTYIRKALQMDTATSLGRTPLNPHTIHFRISFNQVFWSQHQLKNLLPMLKLELVWPWLKKVHRPWFSWIKCNKVHSHHTWLVWIGEVYSMDSLAVSGIRPKVTHVSNASPNKSSLYVNKSFWACSC